MAIRLKAASLNEAYSYISKTDPAVDSERDDFDECWQRYRDGMDEPPLKSGQEPTVFRLKPLGGSVVQAKLADVSNDHGPVTSAITACAMALEGVQNLQGADGKFFKLEFTLEDGYRMVAPGTLNQLPLDLLVELGTVAIESMAPSRD